MPELGSFIRENHRSVLRAGGRGTLEIPKGCQGLLNWEEACSGPRSAVDQEDPAAARALLSAGIGLARTRVS